MVRKNAFYAQSGGVTAVINASACGVLETARDHLDEIGKVYAGRNGIIGALTEDLIDTSAEFRDAIAALKHTPGAAFGSCRYKLGSIQEHRAQYERLIEVFRAHDIGYFFTTAAVTRKTPPIKSARLAPSSTTRSSASASQRQWIMTYRLPTVRQGLAQQRSTLPPRFARPRLTWRR